MVRIMVVDDHSLVRKQLRQVIQGRNGWEVCGEASDGDEAIRQHSALRPELIIMDFNMPQVDGIQAAREILSNQPNVPIIMISISDSHTLIEEIKKVGIRGFCCKDKMNDLASVVNGVLRGDTPFIENAH